MNVLITYLLIGVLLSYIIDSQGGQHFSIGEKIFLIILWPFFLITGIIALFKS